MQDELRKRAIELAVNQVMTVGAAANHNAYRGYELLKESVKNGSEPPRFALWCVLEGMSNENLLDHIEREADSIENAMMDVLDMAKAGIVHQTIECKLDSDMNALDMRHMVDVGASHV